jgi:hypothetical protein
MEASQLSEAIEAFLKQEGYEMERTNPTGLKVVTPEPLYVVVLTERDKERIDSAIALAWTHGFWREKFEGD